MRVLVVVMLLFACDGSLPEPILTGPPEPARTQRLIPDWVGLVGRTSTACSHGAEKGFPDTWCAFYRTTGEANELWVLNVTRAVTGAVACDGSSPHCLLLTTNLWIGSPVFSQAHPAIHGFEGNTLFIYSDSQTTKLDESYKGPIKAWRPGWPEARVISTASGYLCHGSPTAPVAYCLDSVVEKNRNFELHLLAGSLAGAAAGPLPSAGRIRALGSQGQVMWGATFSPDGAHFLLSSPADGEDVEVLRMGRVSDGGLAPPAEILRGIGRWRIAPDGKKLYYLKDYNYADGEPSGTLTMVDLPAITNPTVLQEKVGLYAPLGGPGDPDRGLSFLQDVSRGYGTFKILRDRTRPATAQIIASGVSEFLVSPDLRYTYLSALNTEAASVGLVASNDGTGSCELNAREGALYSVGFTPDGGTVFWAQDGDMGLNIDGWYADSHGCASKRRFSTDLAYLAPVRGGVVYADSDPDRQTMTLKFAALNAGSLPDEGGTVVAEKIDTTIARAGSRYVLFTISRGEESNHGLYVYGPLP